MTVSTHVIEINRIQPTKDRVLVVQYERPAMSPGGIHIPDTARSDALTWSYWEVVKCGPQVAEALGYQLRPGDIIRTPFRPAIDLAIEDGRGRRLFIIGCTVQRWDSVKGKMATDHNINGVIPRDWEE